MIITLDGPAGVGKSTLATQLATHFCIPCLDTGAMYRSIGLKLGASVADMDDDALHEKLARFTFALRPYALHTHNEQVNAQKENIVNPTTPQTLEHQTHINQEEAKHNTSCETAQNTRANTCCPDRIQYTLYFNDHPIGDKIRTEKVGRLAAIVASLPVIRKALQGFQRSIGEQTSLVTEGRDMGTTVFPSADVKFFLDARPDIRAQRRYLELQAKDENTATTSLSYDEILHDINMRDEKDRNRRIDPLKPAHDAILIDTSDLTQEEVLQKLIQLVENKFDLSSAEIQKREIEKFKKEHALQNQTNNLQPQTHSEQIKQEASFTQQSNNTPLDNIQHKDTQQNIQTHTPTPHKKQADTILADTVNIEESVEFSHLAKDGSLAMVAVEHKAQTLRKALAYGFVRMTSKTIDLLRTKALPKGDVLSVAKVAGIMGAKRTADAIPLCHPILLSYVDIRFNVNDYGVEILSEVRTCHNTGVEMEAIIAVQIAAATIYDMVKAVQKDMIIENVHLLYKEGGKTLFTAPDYSDSLIEKFA